MLQPDHDTAARRVTATELGRFEQCRLAWWYDRTHSLAKASAFELAKRIALFEAVYGPGAHDLPEYHLMTHLRERAEDAPPPPPIIPEPVVPFDSPAPLVRAGVLVAAIVIGLVGAGLVFSFTHR